MPLFHNHVGINLTETKLQLVEISYKQNIFCLENVDQLVFKEPLYSSTEELILIDVLRESFSKINQKKLITSNLLSFSLPNNFFKIFEIPYDDTLTKKDLVEHIRWELSVLYPMYDCKDFLIQYIEVDKSNIRPEYKLIVFALDKKLVGAINKFCKENKYELKYIDNAHLASNAFLHLDKNTARDRITFSFYIDQHFSSLAVFEGLLPFYFKIFNDNGEDFFDQLRDSLASLALFNIHKENINNAILSGQSVTGEFAENISKAIGVELLKINPFEKLKVEENVRTNPLYLTQFNSFTAAAGIAIRIV
ncbi:MAG: hypothetical protein RDU14_11855 [Melioribacteraceae bacterium]|nr:hypothetical protein [Melioribacteraceae bacterium]